MSERQQRIEWLEEYIDWQKNVRRRSPLTTTQYKRTLYSFLHGIKDEPTLNALSVSAVETWLMRPRDGRGHGKVGSPATLHREAATLRSFFRFLLERGHIHKNVMGLVGTPTVKNVAPRAIADDHWNALWESATERERLVLGLGYYVGLRRVEIVTLRRTHVVGDKLVGFVRKGGGEDVTPWGTMCRVYQKKLAHIWHGDFTDAVIEASTREGEWLCGLGMESTAHAVRVYGFTEGASRPGAVNLLMERLCERARLPKVTPHQLRHSAATNMVRAGVPLVLVSRLLNHSEIQTTMRYVRAGAGELDEWLGS